MKIYDSSNPVVKAAATGTTVALSAPHQGTNTGLSVTGDAHAVVQPLTNVLYLEEPHTQSLVLSGIADGDTLVINGVTFTAKTAPSGAVQFGVGASDTEAAANLAAAVNAYFVATGASFLVGSTANNTMSFQAEVAGSGAVSATVEVDVSNDGVNWVTLATYTLSGTNKAGDGSEFAAGWDMVRARYSAVSGTGAVVSAYMGG